MLFSKALLTATLLAITSISANLNKRADTNGTVGLPGGTPSVKTPTTTTEEKSLTSDGPMSGMGGMGATMPMADGKDMGDDPLTTATPSSKPKASDVPKKSSAMAIQVSLGVAGLAGLTFLI